MVENKENDSLITLQRSTFQKFIDEAYERGKRDAMKEMRSRTHKAADIGGMAYKANIVFDDEDEENERKSKQTDK